MHAPILSIAHGLQRWRWVHLPAAILVALLQRTPVLRALLGADLAFALPSGAVLKSAFAGATALGVVDTLAGATTFTVNPPSPINGRVGESLSIAFAYSGTPTPPASYQILGTLPPGVSVPGIMPNGVLNDDLGTITGIPTAAGTYDITIQGFNTPNASGMTNGVLQPVRIIIAPAAQAAPAFTTHPTSQSVAVGGNVTFTVAVTGSPQPTLQWQRDGVAIQGQTGSSLALTNVQASQAGNYTVVATNAAGSVTSNVAMLTVTGGGAATPTITAHPVSVNARSGTTVALTVAATNATSFQWRRNGGAIAGGTSDTLILENVSASQAGNYSVVVSNGSNEVTSEAAEVTVSGSGSSRIFNLSVRTNLAAGGTLIFGFIANGEKTMLVRAIGPTLGDPPINLTGVHPDPRMDLVPAGGSTIESNDDWPESLASVFPTVGAFPLTPNSRDAAIRRTITGANSAVVQGSGSGVLLVETYDAGGSGRLVNVSARNRVGTGADVLIAGFVIDGNVAKTVIVRAVGPKLAEFGVPGALANPKLELFNQANEKIAENDQWNAAHVSVINRSGASGLPLTPGSNDSTLIITLNPGLYSAIVSGVGNTTGEALVEVYELP